jgi:hypothetical protein
LVRYGPIITNVWMPRRVGVFRKDAWRRACMLALTRHVLDRWCYSIDEVEDLRQAFPAMCDSAMEASSH